jgi:hypothetical protein
MQDGEHDVRVRIASSEKRASSQSLCGPTVRSLPDFFTSTATKTTGTFATQSALFRTCQHRQLSTSNEYFIAYILEKRLERSLYISYNCSTKQRRNRSWRVVFLLRRTRSCSVHYFNLSHHHTLGLGKIHLGPVDLSVKEE